MRVWAATICENNVPNAFDFVGCPFLAIAVLSL
jgi:hypothetical protein